MRPLRPHHVDLLPGEEFRPVVSADRYLVSNLGRVFSTIRSGRFLSQTVSPQGYRYVSLMIGDTPVKTLVHRIVAEAFVGGRSADFVVNHLNGDKLDNRAINLEWCSYGANNEHARSEGLNNAFGERHYAARLSQADVDDIRDRAARGEMHREIAAAYGIVRQQITKIINNQAWARS